MKKKQPGGSPGQRGIRKDWGRTTLSAEVIYSQTSVKTIRTWSFSLHLSDWILLEPRAAWLECPGWGTWAPNGTDWVTRFPLQGFLGSQASYKRPQQSRNTISIAGRIRSELERTLNWKACSGFHVLFCLVWILLIFINSAIMPLKCEAWGRVCNTWKLTYIYPNHAAGPVKDTTHEYPWPSH